MKRFVQCRRCGLGTTNLTITRHANQHSDGMVVIITLASTCLVQIVGSVIFNHYFFLNLLSVTTNVLFFGSSLGLTPQMSW